MSNNPFDAPASNDLESTSYQGPLATVGQRAAAKLVDILLLTLAIGLGVGPIFIDLLVFGNEEEPGPLGLLGSALILFLVIGISIFQWVLITNTGQSIGKRMLGIQIRKDDGQLPGFVHGVLLREWIPNLIIGFFNNCCLGWIPWLVDYLYVLGEDRKCLHDRIASTTVIALEKSSP